jgi:hypothetical protein
MAEIVAPGRSVGDIQFNENDTEQQRFQKTKDAHKIAALWQAITNLEKLQHDTMMAISRNI